MKFIVTKQHQNILFVFGIVLLTVVIAFAFIYKPKETEAIRLKESLKAVEASLKDIHAIVGENSDLGKGILRLRDESTAFEAKFIKPEAVSSLIETLSSEARGHGLELVSMNPSEFTACHDLKGKAIKFDGLECHSISVEMHLVGNYRHIIDYLDTLENKNTLQLRVERFNIDRQDDPNRLKAYVVIDSFALIKTNEPR